MMSKFDRITTFVTVFSEGSFAACARKNGLSTAAISKQVSLLEEELGFGLLHRSTRKLALTEAGALYFEQAKQLLSDMAEMEAIALEMRKEPFGTLKVASQRYFAENYILPNLPDFLERFPKIGLQLELLERFPDLEREGLDILIGMSRPPSLHVKQKTIGYTSYVLCASPKYLKRFGTPLHPQDLRKNHRYINHMLRVPVHLTKFKDEQELYLEPYLLLNDTRAMRECAINGIGIVKLHRYVVEEALSSGKLVEILADYNEGKQPIYIAYQPHKHVPPKIRVFIDYFTKRYQEG